MNDFDANLLYGVAQIREIETSALATLPGGTLMQRAGKAVAEMALELLAESTMAKDSTSTQQILILAGPGNNGGDGCEAAAKLALAGAEVTLMMCADPAKYSNDASLAWSKAKAAPVKVLHPDDLASIGSQKWALVIDGLFGIGLTRAIDGFMREVVLAVNAVSCPTLAIDVPSGLDADTGKIVGDTTHPGCAIQATHTLSFIGNKPGLHTADGRDYAGQVHVNTLEISENLYPPPRARINTLPLFASRATRRRYNSHKGTYGDLYVIGGAEGMSGAAILAGRTAMHCGAGRTFVGFVGSHLPFDTLHPELMLRAAGELDLNHANLVVGPGLGQHGPAPELVARALNTPHGLVLDADALNLIAANPALQDMLGARANPAILTPHPLEAARLLHTSVADIQNDRLRAARVLSKRLCAIVVLKGSGTIIANPDGQMVINTSGGPALATAGSGDVLAGACGALLAQGWPAWEAALAAVNLHGQAGDDWTRMQHGTVGLTASELPALLRNSLNRISSI